MGWAEVIAGVLGLAAAFLTYLKGKETLSKAGKEAVNANEQLVALVEAQAQTIVDQQKQIAKLLRERNETLTDAELIELANRLTDGVYKN